MFVARTIQYTIKHIMLMSDTKLRRNILINLVMNVQRKRPRQNQNASILDVM
jgi:hypothetical protein